MQTVNTEDSAVTANWMETETPFFLANLLPNMEPGTMASVNGSG